MVINHQPVELLALEVDSINFDWQNEVAKSISTPELKTSVQKGTIYAHDPKQKIRLPSRGYFSYGCKIRSFWIGTNRKAICILPYRLYFTPEGNPDLRPEREIVDLTNKPNLPLKNRLDFLKNIKELLKSSSVFTSISDLEINGCHTNLNQTVKIRSSGTTYPHTKSPRAILKDDGFAEAPETITLAICTDLTLDSNFSLHFGRFLQEEFAKTQVKVSLSILNLEKIEDRVQSFQGGKSPKRFDVPVLFLLKSKQSPPSDRLLAVMNNLERFGIPWRRAYSDDDLRWSIPDQLGSLLAAAGGISYKIGLGDCELPWSIGIDLSHRDNFSRASVTLVNPEGQLRRACTLKLKTKRENLDQAAVHQLITGIINVSHDEITSKQLLIFRDGRLFDSEHADYYRKEIGFDVSLVEFRKYNNPPLLIGSNPPDTPTLAWLKTDQKESIGFLVTLPQIHKGEHDRVFKVHMKHEWNGLNLKQEKLGKILCALSMAPGLGLHPKALPAPLYWADGIAGASDKDLRFRGQSVVSLD